jgi:hypothetical protein
MKCADTIELVLKGKPDNRALSVTPDHSVYEAIEKMAVEGVGAMLVISANQLVGILSERSVDSPDDFAVCVRSQPQNQESVGSASTPGRLALVTGGRGDWTSGP